LPTDQELIRLLRKYALLNADSHNGRADRGAVIGRLMAEESALRRESRRVSELASKVISEINALTTEEQDRILRVEFPDVLEAETQRKNVQARRDAEKGLQLPELGDAKDGAVVTRFPPEPNGYAHIGHAKAAFLGSEYAKMYHGKFIMRFDDTNPSAEKREYYEAFLDSFSWLGIEPDLVKNSSDDMEKFYALAEKLIRSGGGYICSCSQEKMRDLRGRGKECEHRTQSERENLSLWVKMISGELAKSQVTLRFRGDMKSFNTTMRDPVLFRIIDEAHPLLAKKYAVWPTYDFAGPVEDSLDGVTHAMRSKEYELRDEQYHAILRSLELRDPNIIEFSRLKLQNTTLSKRTLGKLIRDKMVEGWDDPRLPTISALRRRGFLAQSIRDFILSMGLSKVESEPTWDLLESINRKLLDPLAKRYFFVPDPVKLRVLNAPKLNVTLKFHPDKDYGERIIPTDGFFFIPRADMEKLDLGSKVRLIEAYNVEIKEKQADVIIANWIGDEKLSGIPKVQWVATGQDYAMLVKVPGPLLINDEFNPDSLSVVNGIAELASREIKPGEHFQFLRFGFCRMDSPGTAIRTHS
jgi:glutamyl-tRNA synthetase